MCSKQSPGWVRGSGWERFGLGKGLGVEIGVGVGTVGVGAGVRVGLGVWVGTGVWVGSGLGQWEAHRRLYHSTLGLIVINKRRRIGGSSR